MVRPKEPIDVKKAREQHANYVRQISNLVETVVQIPVNEELPDMVYVEDPVVVVGRKALLTSMSQPSRRGERAGMRAALEKLNLTMEEMRESARLDGGDVLFTGREFLVGLSARTNPAGVAEIARVFPQWPVTGITVMKGSNVLHLKSMSAMAGEDLIAIGSSAAAKTAWREIETKAHFKYRRLLFPDDNGANCLYINGVVLHPSKEDYPESFKVWETLNCPRVSLPNSELAKADGSLTCNSVLIN